MNPTASPAESPAHLRPLDVAELIDQSVRLYRRHFRALFVTALGVNAGVFAFSALFQSWYFGQFRLLQDPAQVSRLVDSGEIAGFLGAFLGGLVVFTLVYVLGYQLLVAALTFGTGRAWRGDTFDVKGAYRAVLRRAPAILGTYLLQGLAIATITALSMTPPLLLLFLGTWGVVAGLLLALATGTVVSLVLVLRWFLTTEVVVLEERAGFAAMRRSSELMAGSVSPGLLGNQKVRASILLSVMLMVNGTLAFAAALPRTILQLVYSPNPLDPTAIGAAEVPLGFLLPAYAVELLGQTVVLPFGLVAIVLFYFDTRIRREGLDLEILAARLAGR